MKLNKIVVALALAATASTAFAAPTGSAYDRIQDSRLDGLAKSDRDQELRIDGLVQVAKDNMTTVSGLIDSQKNFVDKTAYGNDKVRQLQTDLDQDALIETNSKKADEALSGVAKNGSEIEEIKTVNKVQDSRLDALENAPKPKDGVNGLDGKDGKDGVNGLDGKDGLNGKDGRDGVDGKDGAAGKDGVNGINGKDGLNGKDGRDGVDGKDGAKGETGLTGAKGADGKDGVNGKDGKAADMTLVNKNTSDIKSLSIDVTTAAARAADLDKRIAEQKATQKRTNDTVAAHSRQLADHENRLGTLESNTNSQFSDLKNRIDDNKREADAGIAGVAAMANIPQVTESQTFAIGAGAGTREGESAVAVGFSARASQNVVVKASVAGDTQQSWTVGAGVSYGW